MCIGLVIYLHFYLVCYVGINILCVILCANSTYVSHVQVYRCTAL